MGKKTDRGIFPMAKVTVCGIRYDNLNLDEAIRRVLRDDCEAQTVVSPNALVAEACASNPEYRRLINSASLVLPDGVGVVSAARRQGTPLRARVCAIDFGERLLAEAAKRGDRVFLLGGRDGVAPAAAENLKKKFPGLCVCGCFWGYFDRHGEENRRLLGIINSCKPSILLVCFGFPIQEQWIRENIGFLPSVRIAAGLGGSFDVWAGRVKRAPAPVRAVRMEWAWRMLREPGRVRQLPALFRFRAVSRKPLTDSGKSTTEKVIR